MNSTSVPSRSNNASIFIGTCTGTAWRLPMFIARWNREHFKQSKLKTKYVFWSDAMRLYHVLWIFISSSFSFNVWANHDDISSHDNENISEATLEQVSVFLEEFINPNKTAAEQAAFFTENVEYYDRGVIGKSAVMKDINYSARRWPWRFYRLAGIDYITRDSAPDADRIFVSYSIDFEVANPSKTISGTASYGAVIVNLNAEPKIEAIAEKVVKRNRTLTVEE